MELSNKGAKELGFADTGAMWRSSTDIIYYGQTASLPPVLSNFDQAQHPVSQHTGYVNDPDMLTVGLSGLTEADNGQLDLFATSTPPRRERLEVAMDAIRDRFGEDAVQRARLLGRATVVRDRIAFGNTGHPDDER